MSKPFSELRNASTYSYYKSVESYIFITKLLKLSEFYFLALSLIIAFHQSSLRVVSPSCSLTFLPKEAKYYRLVVFSKISLSTDPWKMFLDKSLIRENLNHISKRACPLREFFA
jgi:hypothetical protein